MGKFVQLKASDGHQFDAYVAEPAGKPRGLVVIAPEIFGVNSHIQSVTDGYAQDGYLAIAPAFFDRAQRKYDAGYTQPDIAAGVEIMKKISFDDAMLDVAAALGDLAVAQHHDLVGVEQGRQAVAGDDHRAALALRAQCGQDLRLGGGVHGRERVVQQQQGRVGEQRARDRHALALAAR